MSNGKVYQHRNAWRQCKSFAPGMVLSLASELNPWRPGGAGHAFYTQALAPTLAANGGSATVQQVVDAAVANLGIKAGYAMEHLRWLYVWPCQGGRPTYLTVNGYAYPAIPIEGQAAEAAAVNATVN